MKEKWEKLIQLAKEGENLSKTIKQSKLANPYRRIYRIHEKRYNKIINLLNEITNKPE